MDELEQSLNKWGAEHIHIMDDNFSLKPGRVKEFCRQIVNRNFKMRWNTPNGLSAKNVDMEMAHLMRKSGCANVSIAIESGSEIVRHELMNKNVSNSEILNALECFNSVGIAVVGIVLFGMPGETAEENEKAVQFIKALPLTSVVVQFVVPFPGTELYNDLIASGRLQQSDTFELDNYANPVSFNEGISIEQMELWKAEVRGHFPRLNILRKLAEAEE